MRKLLLLFALPFAFCAHIAAYTLPKDTFFVALTTIAAYNPNNEMFDFKYPYALPLLNALYTHRFINEEEGQTLSANIGANLAPVWLNASADIRYSPWKPVTLTLGAEGGTSFNMSLGSLDLQSLAVYDSNSCSYDSLTPFLHYRYALYAQAALSFDIGSFTLSGNYRASYVGMTGVEDGEMWKYMFSKENVNGFRYDAAATISYRLQGALVKTAGVTATASGYFSDSFFASRYENYDATFTSMTLTPTISLGWSRKDFLSISSPFASSRDFCRETDGDDDADFTPFTASDGAKWSWNGILLTYTHVF